MKCRALGCQNDSKDGEFVYELCAPCDAALKFGTGEYGTSILFTQKTRIAALEAELAHKEAYYAQFDLTPKPGTPEAPVEYTGKYSDGTSRLEPRRAPETNYESGTPRGEAADRAGPLVSLPSKTP